MKVEDGRNKCFKYFPTALEERLKFGAFELHMKRALWEQEVGTQKVTCRMLVVARNGEPRNILHVLYDCWPDKVPSSSLV